MDLPTMLNDAAAITGTAAAIPTPIAPELALASTFLGWVGGVVARRAAGAAPTQGEAAILTALEGVLGLARTANDASDAAAAKERAAETK